MSGIFYNVGRGDVFQSDCAAAVDVDFLCIVPFGTSFFASHRPSPTLQLAFVNK